MSNKISRRTFLKCTGVSAAALGAAAMLGGCGSSTSNAIEVKVGDKVSNWNNLGVQLTSVFTMANTPDLPDHEYVAVLVTAVNRSGAHRSRSAHRTSPNWMPPIRWTMRPPSLMSPVSTSTLWPPPPPISPLSATALRPRSALTSSSMMPPLRASPSPPICPRRAQATSS
mgnify:CR=1 FL=1